VTPLMDARLDWIRGRGERQQTEREAIRLREMQERDHERFRALAAEGELRVNVASGPALVEGWVNVDLNPAFEGLLYLDATQRWPLPDESVDAINSEHFIEHLSLEEGQAYLSEAVRVLKPGGVMRTSTPSLRGIIDAYIEADPTILAKYRERVQPVGVDARNHAELVNNNFYEWGHRHIYDVESLTEELERAGLSQIQTAEFGRSEHDVLNGIDTHDDGELLRDLVFALDAVKP
jgi:predicted SAM-dependent methyltransferase